MLSFRSAAVLSIGLLFLIGGVETVSPFSTASAEENNSPTSDTTGIAVVELFTSEGCSSCPPADELLRSVVESARGENQPIYALSFHVDYWNRLGWEDPYSKETYSQRQRKYAQVLDEDVYTPQMIVNGRHAFVGSQSHTLNRALETALGDPPSAQLQLQADIQGQAIELQYEVAGSIPTDATVRLAIVERGLTQEVSRGENAGRTLHHANVVRTFSTVPAKRNGTTKLTVPSEVDQTNASIIGYVQSPSLEIVGGAKQDLHQTTQTNSS